VRLGGEGEGCMAAQLADVSNRAQQLEGNCRSSGNSAPPEASAGGGVIASGPITATSATASATASGGSRSCGGWSALGQRYGRKLSARADSTQASSMRWPSWEAQNGRPAAAQAAGLAAPLSAPLQLQACCTRQQQPCRLQRSRRQGSSSWQRPSWKGWSWQPQPSTTPHQQPFCPPPHPALQHSRSSSSSGIFPQCMGRQLLPCLRLLGGPAGKARTAWRAPRAPLAWAAPLQRLGTCWSRWWSCCRRGALRRRRSRVGARARGRWEGAAAVAGGLIPLLCHKGLSVMLLLISCRRGLRAAKIHPAPT
jgi:hypothetical protein